MKITVQIGGGGLSLWQHKHDVELGGVRWVVDPDNLDALNGAPEVFPMLDRPMAITRQWQYYCRAINYGMSIQHVSALFGTSKAFTNGNGWNHNEPRANWLLVENLNSPLPKFSKVYTCGGSLLTGVVSGTDLIVRVMDGTQEPPLKPGRTYPQNVEQIDPDDYAFMPRTHPWMFLVATNVKGTGTVFPFANGGIYPWRENGGRQYTFLPHVSNFEVRYPLFRLNRLPDGAPIPSAYWSA
jgi:hypothetical protein